MKEQKKLYVDVYDKKEITKAQEDAIQQLLKEEKRLMRDAVERVVRVHGNFTGGLAPLNTLQFGLLIRILGTGEYTVSSTFEDYLRSEIEVCNKGTYAYSALKRVYDEYTKRKNEEEL